MRDATSVGLHRLTTVTPCRGLKEVIVLTALASMGGAASAATVSPVGYDFQVNTYTTGAQLSPTVGTDATGGFVVVWAGRADQDGDGYGIFGQRYGSDGAPLGGEFPINTHTTGDQGGPQLAVDAAGGFVVVWTADGQDGDGKGVFGQRYNSAGTPLGAEFQINTYTTGEQSAEAVALDSSGGFVVVWRDGSLTAADGQDGSATGVHARRFDSAGTPLGGEFQVNTYTTDRQYGADVATDAAGNFIVVWQDRSGATGPSTAIVARRYDSAATPAGDEFLVAEGINAAVGTDAGGGFVVAWYGPRARRYDSAGIALGSEFQLSTYPGGLVPYIAVDATGAFTAVWTNLNQDGDAYGAFGRRFDAAGMPTTGEFQVNGNTTNSQFASSVALGPDGTFVAVWSDGLGADGNDGSSAGVFGRRFSTCEFACAACERCVPDVGCVIGPRDICREPSDPLAKAVVDLKNDPARDKLSWKWVKGSTQPWTFGRPDDATDYTLCVFETVGGSPSLFLDFSVPAGGECLSGGASGTDCWKALGDPSGSRGFKYRDRDLTPDGIDRMRLKPGGGLKGKITIKGKGANLGIPTLGLGLPVTVQLQAEDAECWEAKYFAPGVSRNTPDRFKARPGSPSGAFIDTHGSLLN